MDAVALEHEPKTHGSQRHLRLACLESMSKWLTTENMKLAMLRGTVPSVSPLLTSLYLTAYHVWRSQNILWSYLILSDFSFGSSTVSSHVPYGEFPLF